VVDEFESGWMLNATSDWIFLLTLLLAVPMFLYLWYLCTKVRWRRLIKKIWKWIVGLFKKIVRFFMGTAYHEQKILAPPPAAPLIKQTINTSRPRAMNFQGTVPSKAPEGGNSAFAATFEPSPTFNATAGSPVRNMAADLPPKWDPNADLSSDDIANIPLEDIQLPQRDAVVEDIPGIFGKAGYDLIPKVKTKLQTLDFLAVCGDKVLACLVDRETGDWLAEEEPFNGEAPLWFSEVDHRVSPIYELRQSVEELQAKISAVVPDLKVQGMMIEEKGNIINAEEMLRVWQELSVIVCRTDIGGTDDLPLTGAVIKSVTPASSGTLDALTKLFKGDK
ncbi:MAG: hypothetical protein II942_00145, partial [Alphaproteobacteria bacterium]|nr:hypothetical protein [Alphaproteobacteria bacterium]